MAVGDGFKIADAYVEIHADPDTARKDVRDLPAKIGPDADRSGRTIGDKVSEGMRMSFVRNSPLIVAAVGAGLAAGAPVAMVGATALFGGIATVAAFQNVQLRESWMGLGKEIRDGAVSDAATVIPVLEKAADKVGASFSRLRPQLRDAFEGVGPQLDDVVDGTLALAENAMPGLFRAIERGKPVTEGLERFLASTGDGLTGFFDNISSHSPAAGQALDSLGDVMGELLPIAGEFLGQGAELASDVLPLLAGSLGAVNKALDLLGPALPIVVAGIAGLKVGQAVRGQVDGLANSLANMGTEGSRVDTISSRAGRTLSAMGNGLPLVGVAVGLIASELNEAGEQTAKWAEGMRTGGAAAREAIAGVAEERAKHADNWFGDLSYNLDQLFGLASSMEDVEAAAGELWRSMSPLEQANQKVAYWTNELAYRMNDEASSAKDVAIAQDRLAHWTNESEQAQSDLESAVAGVNVAMVEQASLVIAAADSSLAYRQSLTSLDMEYNKVAEAIREYGVDSDEAKQATEGVEQAVLRSATAAQRYAMDISTADSEQGKAAEGAAAYLAQLYSVRQVMGTDFPAALQQTITQLEATTDRGSVAAWQFHQLGATVGGVPGHKYVDVQSAAPWQIEQFRQLGFRIETLPDGSVRLYADTAAAEQALNSAARPRTAWITAAVNASNAVARLGQLAINGRAAGGPVYGPGTGTSDSIPATGPGGSMYALSNGEHVITDAEVRGAGGHGAVMAVRQLMKSGAFKLAEGGGASRFGPIRPQAAPLGRVGTTVHIASLTLQVAGNLDPTNPTAFRQAVDNLRAALRDLERSES